VTRIFLYRIGVASLAYWWWAAELICVIPGPLTFLSFESQEKDDTYLVVILPEQFCLELRVLSNTSFIASM
jgi:hypothetical protein